MSEDGIRVDLRMIVSHEAEQRFDTSGTELLQIRGHAVDAEHGNPLVVVRFAGQQQAQLARWCKPGKHLSVGGLLEIKTWTTWATSTGSERQPVIHTALLIEAKDIHPLNPDEVNHSREGVYAALGRTSKVAPAAPPASRAERAARLRQMVESDER